MHRLQKVQANRIPWNDRVLKPSKDRVEGHRKQEAARRTALSHAPGHDELSSGHSCKFHVRGAVAVDSSKETANELGQLCSFQYMEDPGVIDIGICSGKIWQKNT